MLNTLLEVKRNTVPNQMSGMLSPLMLTTLITFVGEPIPGAWRPRCPSEWRRWPLG